MKRAVCVALGILSVPAAAQMVQQVPGVNANDPLNSLSMHLRSLAANPRDLFALLGAGKAALDVGDPNAALGFFARADEIDPRSGKAKAGLASALVMLEKPDDALQLFAEAASLGISDSDLARDRGLAYDLRGDNRRAQRDYAVAMRRDPDDDLIRRYALSLGISGDRAQAMTMLDPLLRKQDQAAWRARAFILAMNNDVSGANAIARQVMPASLAGTMSPFLTRLARLNAAERAHAVNFGTMPSDGQTFATVQTGNTFKPFGLPSGAAGDGLIPAGAPLGRQTVASAAPTTRQERRRRAREPVVVARSVTTPPVLATPNVTPGFSTPPSPGASARLDTRVGRRIAAVDPARLPPEVRGQISGIILAPMKSLPPPDRARAATMIVPVPTVVKAAAVVTSRPQPTLQPTTLSSPLPPPPRIEDDPGLASPSVGVVGPPAETSSDPAPFEVAPRAAAAAPVPVAPPVSRLAMIMEGLTPENESAPVALPTAAQARAAQRLAARKVQAATEAAAAAKLAKDEKAKQLTLAKASPARIWVQVATGNNEAGLGITWRRIRDANVSLLKSYGGYSVSYKATNRVLAGPVKSSADARALINALGKAGVSATTYASEAGQEVVKLGGK